MVRDGGAWGEADVTGASNPVAALIARIVGFPTAGQHKLHVHFEECDGGEIWTRDFGGKRFRSHLTQRSRWLVERFGPFHFAFALLSDKHGLAMDLRRWWIGPFRLPTAWAPRSPAREWAEDGRFYFDVPIDLPVIGRLIHYRGWLRNDSDNIGQADERSDAEVVLNKTVPEIVDARKEPDHERN